MNRSFIKITLPMCISIVLAGIWLARAGDLNPPLGVVMPTMKTINELEPRIAINATNTPGDSDSLFKISQPGSYFLTGNITGVSGKHGIEIVAHGVTLDLNGFELDGVAGSGSLDGVSATLIHAANIAVFNGSVRNWGDEGVDLMTYSAINCRVNGVLAKGNTYGISAGNGSAVLNCLATNNAADGIHTSVGSTVSNCTAIVNVGDGISTSSGCTTSNCSSCNNTGEGIRTFIGSTVSNCTALNNAGAGISTHTGCTVAYCTAQTNSLDGIVCSSACVIRGNTCSDNGESFGVGDGAGIHATGSANRIEGNNCTGADRGIHVESAGNIIIKNTCSGNDADWVFAANNVFGPIIDRRAPASAAVNGFSATSSLGSTDPNANFSY